MLIISWHSLYSSGAEVVGDGACDGEGDGEGAGEGWCW